MTDHDQKILEEVSEFCEEHKPGRVYKSLPELLRDILEYVKSHPGCEVVSFDDAVRMHIGFYVDGLDTYWGLGLLGLREFSTTVAETDRLEVMGYLSTPAGRSRLAACLKEGRVPFSCPGLQITT